MDQRMKVVKKTGVGLVAAAVASGMLGAAAVGSSPVAGASCASFFGISSSADCSSNFTSVAIALGVGATAHSDGLFGAAFALGDATAASLTGGSLFGTAAALGNQVVAGGSGFAPLAIAIGTTSMAIAGMAGSGSQIGNVAMTVGDLSTAFAAGIASSAVTLGSSGAVTAVNGTLSSAVSVLSSGTNMSVGPGPLAIAGSFFQRDAVVNQIGPGLNINGLKLGGNAAPQRAATARATDTSSSPVTPGAKKAAAASAKAADSKKPSAGAKKRVGAASH